MVADRGGLHTDQVVDGNVHRRNRMIGAGREADGGAGYRVELIAHADIGAAIEEGAGDEVVAAGEDQGVGELVVEPIHQPRQEGSGLGRQEARLAIGEVEQLQAPGNREINNRHHIIPFAGGNHTAGRIGGTGEEGDPLNPLGTGEDDRIHGHRVIGIRNIKDRRHAGGGAFQGHKGIGAAVDGEHLHHFGLDTLGIFTIVDRIETTRIGEIFEGNSRIPGNITFGIEDSQ